MKRIIYPFLSAILIFTLACTNKNKPAKSETNQPIMIPNVFPEKGLTDAHTIIDNGRLYAFCGHDKTWDTENAWIMDRWEIWSTDNLVDWKKENEIHPKDTYIGDIPNCFAGDIISRNGKYYWYFSNRNISTGVMVSDSPTGPFKDALGKPLLPEGIVPVHAYDPEIFEENGTYTIIFGAGHYHAATLSEDMISLADEPKPILVLDKEGKDMWTADKSCIFKRDGKYYLIWEEKYAISDHLRGPYTYMGESLKGGHCNVFEWEGQHYALLENKDISLFYRGVSLKPLHFNKDGSIIIPEDDAGFPANGRAWNFEHSEMGWRAISGTDVNWDQSGKIYGKLSGNAVIESSVWLLTNLKEHQTLVIRMKNESSATQAKISIASTELKGAFWKNPEINWDDQDHILVDVKANSAEIQEFEIDLSTLPKLKSILKRLRIEPAVGASEGSWEIESIQVN
ncbi:hypothetical protein BZG02_15640 [Labilibaculum filiforme]|uniref:Glycosyl hydrolase family 43 n=1 Tax=Labilibaculum filiforme TaxID=1940526 RepID=A0A2N3HTN3_9BACT|nr:family 43 glycosylhydrolase [Labilibaculum filiforme]PKQ61391.1 hypothetical protein BZG02_15640 [Labilibaculum filiforme]